MSYNPWQARHAADEAVYQDGNATLAAAIVANEYAEGGGPVACPKLRCDGTAFYKATIGVHKCTRCGELCDEWGDPL